MIAAQKKQKRIGAKKILPVKSLTKSRIIKASHSILAKGVRFGIAENAELFEKSKEQ